jgi:hypothetical protein
MNGVGSVAVSVSDKMFVCAVTGHLTLAITREAHERLDRLALEHPLVTTTLYDGTHMSSFEPGLPIRWIKWAMARPHRSHRVALVGTHAATVSIAGTFRYFLPKLRYGVFNSRAAALAFLRHDDDSTPRRRVRDESLAAPRIRP